MPRHNEEQNQNYDIDDHNVNDDERYSLPRSLRITSSQANAKYGWSATSNDDSAVGLYQNSYPVETYVPLDGNYDAPKNRRRSFAPGRSKFFASILIVNIYSVRQNFKNIIWKILVIILKNHHGFHHLLVW